MPVVLLGNFNGGCSNGCWLAAVDPTKWRGMSMVCTKAYQASLKPTPLKTSGGESKNDGEYEAERHRISGLYAYNVYYVKSHTKASS